MYLDNTTYYTITYYNHPRRTGRRPRSPGRRRAARAGAGTRDPRSGLFAHYYHYHHYYCHYVYSYHYYHHYYYLLLLFIAVCCCLCFYVLIC